VEDGPIVNPLAEGVGVEDTSQEHDGFFGGVPVLVGVARRYACAARIIFSRLGRGLGRRRTLGLCRLGSAGLRLRGAARTGSLLLVVDWDLIIVIAISIPVRLVSCVLFVRRRRAIVDEVVVVTLTVVVVDDLRADVLRLRRSMLPLAMGALERRGI
jgi:hypothetical protein